MPFNCRMVDFVIFPLPVRRGMNPVLASAEIAEAHEMLFKERRRRSEHKACSTNHRT
jgi:hypothetical protein